MANVYIIDANDFTCNGGRVIDLTSFVQAVRRVDPDAEHVEAIVSSVLSINSNADIIYANAKVDEFGERYLAELISRPQIISFMVFPLLKTRHVSGILRRCVIPKTKSKRMFEVRFDVTFSMTVNQAQEIFSTLCGTSCQLFLGITWLSRNNDVMDSFCRFVQHGASSIRGLMIYWLPNRQGHLSESSERQFSAFCNSLSQNRRLRYLVLQNIPVQEALLERAAQDLSNAITTSSSIKVVSISDEQGDAQHMVDKMQQSLLQSAPINSFDLFFQKRFDQKESTWELHFGKRSKFKQLLPKNVPLGLWPLILARANSYHHYDSHSSLDLLYYLIKEKHDVLLLNVRYCRSIRKSSSFIPNWFCMDSFLLACCQGA